MKELKMNVTAVTIKYRRPGMALLCFSADYPKYSRRGTIVFDTVHDLFITHTADIKLLSKVCVFMQKPTTRSNT